MDLNLEKTAAALPIQNFAITHGISRLKVETRQVRRRVETGELRRVRRGVYIPSREWDALGDRERHIARMQAEQQVRDEPIVFAGDSAAAAWNLPAYGYYGHRAHGIVDGYRRSTESLEWHCGAIDDDEIVTLGAFQVTSLLRTLVDLARESAFPRGVGYVDAGIRIPRQKDAVPHVAKAELLDRLDDFSGRRGYRRALAIVEFAREKAESLGESISRVVQYVHGFPEPELQFAVRDENGLIGFADQAWPEFAMLGEFDGYTKYTRSAYTAGRSIEEIVFAEKKREDRMRATGRGMCRWLWDDVHKQAGLVAILKRAGLPQGPLRPLLW